jgi:hypothetical protein
MTDHKPMPVHGYTSQSQERIDIVNEGKALEERVLRYIEKVNAFNTDASGATSSEGARASALGRSYIQTGWMWVFRSIFQPQRAKLPEDANP